MNKGDSKEVFFALVRTGLFPFQGTESQIDVEVDWTEVMRLAETQSVTGLVASGMEYLRFHGHTYRMDGTDMDCGIPLTEKMKLMGMAMLIEQRNTDMNHFIHDLVEELYNENINTLLVKGQGVAQCYTRPLWRACGDVDFLFDEEGYEKAKKILTRLATKVEPEGQYKKHLAMHINHWTVELHGNMRCGLSRKMDKELDFIQCEMFNGGDVRSWMNSGTKINLPGVNSDILFVFTHFIKRPTFIHISAYFIVFICFF